jgi:hypothetical protein
MLHINTFLSDRWGVGGGGFQCGWDVKGVGCEGGDGTHNPSQYANLSDIGYPSGVPSGKRICVDMD